LKFPKGGLGPIQSDPQNKDIFEVEIAKFEEDNDSNGTRVLRIARVKD